MKIVIITQEEYFIIPRNIEKVIALNDIEVELIVVLDTRGSLVNKKTFFMKGFGPIQASRMAIKVMKVRAFDRLDQVCGWRLFRHKWSIRAVANRYRIPFEIIKNPNDKEFCHRLSRLLPSVILSFSAPVIFKSRLLNIPQLGCINLHCSCLPKYAGLLPSFWVLFYNEIETGASVHYMNDKVDSGGILGQVKVPIYARDSMFDVIMRTKKAGGNLVCDIIRKMAYGEKLEVKPNSFLDRNYFSWPSIEQMVKFRKQGGRCI